MLETNVNYSSQKARTNPVVARFENLFLGEILATLHVNSTDILPFELYNCEFESPYSIFHFNGSASSSSPI